MADVASLIQKIQSMNLSEDDKSLFIAELNEKGEAAILDIMTLLELKAQNADLAASTLDGVGDEMVADIQQAILTSTANPVA